MFGDELYRPHTCKSLREVPHDFMRFVSAYGVVFNIKKYGPQFRMFLPKIFLMWVLFFEYIQFITYLFGYIYPEEN